MFKLDNMLSKNINTDSDESAQHKVVPDVGSVVIQATEFAKPKYLLNIKVTTSKSGIKEFYNKFTSHHKGDSGIDLIFNDNVIVDKRYMPWAAQTACTKKGGRSRPFPGCC